jgi:SH3-like domain-containing protein
MAAETVFTANGEPIETVKDFKYLGRILSDNDSDEACVERNLKRAKGKWGMICRIFSSEDASPKVMGTFYKNHRTICSTLRLRVVGSNETYDKETGKLSPTLCKIHYRHTYSTERPK